MSEHRKDEAPSHERESAEAEQAVADMKESIDRLRGHLGVYRDQVMDNDNDNSGGEGPEA
ncbi:MAG TPA: hypothetical protein VF138_02920 [Caulobacteraceae bacterium]